MLFLRSIHHGGLQQLDQDINGLNIANIGQYVSHTDMDCSALYEDERASNQPALPM